MTSSSVVSSTPGDDKAASRKADVAPDALDRIRSEKLLYGTKKIITVNGFRQERYEASERKTR